MARNFVASSTQRIVTSSDAPMSNNTAFTISFWYKTTSTANQKPFSEWDDANYGAIIFVTINEHTTGDLIFGIINDAGTFMECLTGAISSNDGNWHNVICIQRSKTDKEIFVDGTSRDTDITNTGTVTNDTFAFGWNGRDEANYMQGDVAECGIWNRGLEAGEIAALSKGYSSSFFLNGLQRYYPLIGRYSPEIDIKGGKTGTLVNTPIAAAHPRIIYPSFAQIRRFTTAAAPAASTYMGYYGPSGYF